MIIFNYFFQILKKYKGMVILYTLLLVFFAGFSLQTRDPAMEFTSQKPDVYVIQQDPLEGVTKSLYEYIGNVANVKELKGDEESLNDALFYRDISILITIPKGYREAFLKGENPSLQIKKVEISDASYMEMLLNRYLKTAQVYQQSGFSEAELITQIKKDVDKTVQVEMKSTVDTSSLDRASFFFNFANYSILAGCVFVIATVMSSFKERNLRKRLTVSSTSYREMNRQLFLANSVFAFVLWLFYILVSVILLKEVMFTMHGVLFMLNSFLFMVCALSIAFLIANVLTSKNAINGIVNVIALGSSFLCGAFVPAAFLPASLLKASRILPSYWYIQNNELIKTIETVHWKEIFPVIQNSIVIILFIGLFIVLTNLISKRNQTS